MSLQTIETPETLPELHERLSVMGCRIVRVHQPVAEEECSATVANAYGYEITETGKTFREAIEKAFVKAFMVGDAA